MEESTPLILAVGGVVLLTWYGFRQVREDRIQGLSAPSPGTQKYRQTADAALSAEFQPGPRGEFEYLGGAVICPHCGIEFPAGTAYCDCGCETVDADEVEDIELPAGNSEMAAVECGNDEDHLVCIHVAGSYWKASLIKSFLESHGISCVTRGNLASAFSHLQLPGESEVRLLVPPQEAPRARALLHKCA